MPTAIAICLGASLGALARWRLALWFNHSHALIPWGTLVANWAGAYAIGLAVVYFQDQTQLDPVWRAAVSVGFLGALTTFSSFSIETVELLQAERFALALGGVALHLGGSLLLTWIGLQTVAWAMR